jgi:hypothetical protein
MKTFGEVIEAFEEAGVDVRGAYWDDSSDIGLVIVFEGRRLVVSSVSYSPSGDRVGQQDGEILVTAAKSPS